MLIVNDQRTATFVAATVLSVALLLGLGAPSGANPIAAQAAASPGVSVTLVQDGIESTYLTRARNVEAFLEERDLHVQSDDFLSVSRDEILVDGMRLMYRPAVPVALYVANEQRQLRTTSSSIADLLTEQGITLAPSDEVTPALDTRPQPNEIVRVVRVNRWITDESESIVPRVRHRFDPTLAQGVTRTEDPGASGERMLTVRYVQRDGAKPARFLLASRIVREPRARIIAHGIGEYEAFAQIAREGFASVVHFAGSALHMVATAYVAGCSGCSGRTAIGLPAGHGVVAVDPRVIPLGTRLYVPGYGRAVAGDTGGAILGNRIDLGFNRLGDALRFGRRPITVYLLR